MQRTHNQTAFTVIEALITIAILSVLMHSAVPALGAMLKRYQLDTLSAANLRLMHSARLQAISHAQPVTWCPMNDQGRCVATDATRVITFEDINNNQQLDENETLFAQIRLSPELRLAMANKDTVRFIANGRTYQPTSIYLCSGEFVRKFTVSFTGRIYQHQTDSSLRCPN